MSNGSICCLCHYKQNNRIAVCATTTGPGCTNTLTGIAAAWQDSIPSIFISGQARSNQLSIKTKTRQVGTQEINSIDLVKSITKYAVILNEKDNINQILENAYSLAISGRPGPVWIEVPLDLQLIKLKNKRFKNKIKKIDLEKNIKEEKKLKSVTSMIYNSKRPLVVAGNGIVTSDTSYYSKNL